MIHWLVQSTSDSPDLGLGRVPAGLLSPTEQVQFSSLKSLKRRREWLLGRWTAKALLQAVFWETTGKMMPFNTFTLENEASGAPRVVAPIPASLSISHCKDRALCAVVKRRRWPVGADLEHITPRLPGFAAQYFTEAENKLLSCAPPDARDWLVTAIWSSKESILKALHLGLTVDTRILSCLIQAGPEALDGWVPVELRWDLSRLQRYIQAKDWPFRNLLSILPTLAAWWRVQGEYVLTLAAQTRLES